MHNLRISVCAVVCFLCMLMMFVSGCGEDKPEAPKKKIEKSIGTKDSGASGKKVSKPIVAKEIGKSDAEKKVSKPIVAKEIGKSDAEKKVSKPIVAKEIEKTDAESASKVTKKISAKEKDAGAEPIITETEKSVDSQKSEETPKVAVAPVTVKIGEKEAKPVEEIPEMTKVAESPKTAESSSAKEEEKDMASDKKSVEKNIRKSEEKPEKMADVANEKPSEADDKKKTDTKISVIEEDIRKDSSDQAKSDTEKLLASADTSGKSDDKKYDSSGRVDPFMPLIKDEDEPEQKKREQKKTERTVRPKTPLEKVDLTQLKLVGIVRAESGNRAMVEQADGKGYIVTKGTFIGIHSGKVVEILRDRVIVEEDQEDWAGNISKSKRELKLQKAPGEDYYEM